MHRVKPCTRPHVCKASSVCLERIKVPPCRQAARLVPGGRGPSAERPVKRCGMAQVLCSLTESCWRADLCACTSATSQSLGHVSALVDDQFLANTANDVDSLEQPYDAD